MSELDQIGSIGKCARVHSVGVRGCTVLHVFKSCHISHAPCYYRPMPGQRTCDHIQTLKPFAGLLAEFESLLSTQGKETGMLGDFFGAILELNRVKLAVVPTPHDRLRRKGNVGMDFGDSRQTFVGE